MLDGRGVLPGDEERAACCCGVDPRLLTALALHSTAKLKVSTPQLTNSSRYVLSSFKTIITFIDQFRGLYNTLVGCLLTCN